MCDDLKLPPKNEFIPTDFDLMPREDTVSAYIVKRLYILYYLIFNYTKKIKRSPDETNT